MDKRVHKGLPKGLSVKVWNRNPEEPRLHLLFPVADVELFFDMLEPFQKRPSFNSIDENISAFHDLKCRLMGRKMGR